MPRQPSPAPGIHLLRTIIVNIITLSVALALRRNRSANPEIAARAWPADQEAPYVQVIIPARNEEGNMPALLAGLLGQRYPAGRWGIIVVDDGSEDSTAEAARRAVTDLSASTGAAPPVRVLATPALPGGWTGKSHALWTGYRATPDQAEWLLFVDADTRHAPLMLSSVVLRAQEAQADLLSLIIRVSMLSFWEKVLVPQVGELYTLLVGTMDQVNGPRRPAAANGQFILIRRELYGRLGSLPEVRGDVAEDRALAAACKSRAYSVRLEYARDLVSARVYSSFREMWAGYTKTLYWASGHNMGRALVIPLALALYALAPVASLLYALAVRGYVFRRAALLHAPLQIVPMLALRAAVARQLGIPAAYALTYPLAVAVGDAMLLYSAYRVVSGKGVRWKGRTYTRPG